MKIVSSNSPEDFARRAATGRVAAALVDLTANLLRVVRGAGKAHLIGRQAAELDAAYDDHWNAFGHYPPNDELEDMLRIELAERRAPHVDEDLASMEYGKEQIVRGALQLAASTLLGQTTQATRGESELVDGINTFEKARDRWRATVNRPARKLSKPRGRSGK